MQEWEPENSDTTTLDHGHAVSMYFFNSCIFCILAPSQTNLVWVTFRRHIYRHFGSAWWFSFRHDVKNLSYLFHILYILLLFIDLHMIVLFLSFWLIVDLKWKASVLTTATTWLCFSPRTSRMFVTMTFSELSWRFCFPAYSSFLSLFLSFFKILFLSVRMYKQLISRS